MASRSIDHQLEYWNTYGPAKPFNHAIDFEQLGQLLNRNSKILDYGCGYGRISNDLYEQGYTHVKGVDFSVNMIHQGRRLYPHLNLEIVDTLPLPFVSEAFDAVLLFTVLTCIPSDKAQVNLIQEIRRILRDGGVLYISDLCLQEDERNLKRYQQFQEIYGVFGIFELPEGAVLRHHDLHWIKALTTGFKQISVKKFDIITMNGNPAKGFQLFACKEYK